MFGNSPVTDLRRAAQAHERAANNAAAAIVNANETVERIEMIVLFLASFVVAAYVMEKVWRS